MSIFKNKETKAEDKAKGSLESQLVNQAKKLGLSVDEIKLLGQGKSCPKFGVTELLHARRTRNGKITVFNISERFRSEKISSGRKQRKNAKDTAGTTEPALATDGTKPQ